MPLSRILAPFLFPSAWRYPSVSFFSKYLVFDDSDLKGRVQFFRYFMICLFNLGLNYILLKILVEYFELYPVLAQIFTIVVVVIFSYLAQRHFFLPRAAA
ncbi:MAG: GtrA family protein [Chitinophagaceae bacterium]|nr:GtrA family protein [Chitinophagaceae bacterium]